jgi:hypothetical protein
MTRVHPHQYQRQTRKIIIEYKLRDIADSKGMVYIQANRGMYGLPQSGLLANELLEKRFNKRGYHQSKLVPGLWSHKWCPVQFTLVVDNFGVKYAGEEHALHLKQTLEENYKCHTGIGRMTIHRHHLRLGLQAPASPFIHAWIHHKGSQTIQARETQIATSTIPQRHHQIWSKDTICHCSINLTTVRQTWQEIHPTSVWQILVFGTSS